MKIAYNTIKVILLMAFILFIVVSIFKVSDNIQKFQSQGLRKQEIINSTTLNEVYLCQD